MAAVLEDATNRLLDWVGETEPTLAGRVAMELPSIVTKADLPAASLTHVRTEFSVEAPTDAPAELNRTATDATLREELATLRLDLQLDLFTATSVEMDRTVSKFLEILVASPRLTTADGRAVRLIYLDDVSQNTDAYRRRIIDIAAEVPLTRDVAYKLVLTGIGTVQSPAGTTRQTVTES